MNDHGEESGVQPTEFTGNVPLLQTLPETLQAIKEGAAVPFLSLPSVLTILATILASPGTGKAAKPCLRQASPNAIKKDSPGSSLILSNETIVLARSCTVNSWKWLISHALLKAPTMAADGWNCSLTIHWMIWDRGAGLHDSISTP